ncbi:hypothetical protein PoB_005640000 [Plakobranchus ocellatus]|uniref:Uncharacterized protein n=1 Tax=Plakobranchus ocellatus TaxID=259542 RepID=A0AAV4CEL7_9GAST|nr:hypothetical protein PoB_005640000 [Plakobranchus ocellatus]
MDDNLSITRLSEMLQPSSGQPQAQIYTIKGHCRFNSKFSSNCATETFLGKVKLKLEVLRYLIPTVIHSLGFKAQTQTSSRKVNYMFSSHYTTNVLSPFQETASQIPVQIFYTCRSDGDTSGVGHKYRARILGLEAESSPPEKVTNVDFSVAARGKLAKFEMTPLLFRRCEPVQ